MWRALRGRQVKVVGSGPRRYVPVGRGWYGLDVACAELANPVGILALRFFVARWCKRD